MYNFLNIAIVMLMALGFPVLEFHTSLQFLLCSCIPSYKPKYFINLEEIQMYIELLKSQVSGADVCGNMRKCFDDIRVLF